jgi:hypothetical protein
MLKVTQTLEITQITHTEIFSYHEDETNDTSERIHQSSYTDCVADANFLAGRVSP